jgi:adenylylsulfate kinase
LYQQQAQGNISSFTGVSAPFEKPMDASMRISTEESSVEACIDQIIKQWKEQKA